MRQDAVGHGRTFLGTQSAGDHVTDLIFRERFEAGKDSFSTYDIESLDAEPVLFQTGYLTIKDVKEQSSAYSTEKIYVLSYPNEEVRTWGDENHPEPIRIFQPTFVP
ncbi:MAG: hypothetical protein GY859_02145 [Desulfobacterales bacterium]|nr:hypothetical protein [Desulfobacterales bacterium]